MTPFVSRYYGKDSKGSLTISEEARSIIRSRCEKVTCKECGEGIELNSEDVIVCKKNPKKHITGWSWGYNIEQPPSFSRIYTKPKVTD